MKFLITIALIATVASAAIIKPAPVSADLAEFQQIVAAITSSSTDPATAIALAHMLAETYGLTPTEAASIVAPALVDATPAFGPEVEISPIAVGPAIVDLPVPIHDGGAITAVGPAPVTQPIVPSPVIIGEIPAGAPAPLVQILVNVNDQQVVVGPAVTPIEQHVPGPVNVVDGISGPAVSPVQVVAPVAPGPVNVVDGISGPAVSPVQVVAPVAPGPVNVVDGISGPAVSPVQVVAPVAPGPVNVVDGVSQAIVEPVVVGTPIIPSPVITLPDTLN